MESCICCFPVIGRLWAFSSFRKDVINLRLPVALRKYFTLRKLSVGVRPLKVCKAWDAFGVYYQSRTTAKFH